MTELIVLLKEGFEEIEALTIVDYLRRADIKVKTLSMEQGKLVRGRSGIGVEADFLFEGFDFSDADALYIPGGLPAAKDLSLDERVIDLLKDFDARGKAIASICAGPLSLEAAGLLRGKSCTSHPSIKEDLTDVNYLEERVVTDQNIITSRGPATAFDLAMKLIELLKGSKKRAEVEEELVN